MHFYLYGVALADEAQKTKFLVDYAQRNHAELYFHLNCIATWPQHARDDSRNSNSSHANCTVLLAFTPPPASKKH